MSADPREGQTFAGESLLVRSVNFVKLRNLVMELPDFDDIPDRGGEKVLEAIQGLWIEEAD